MSLGRSALQEDGAPPQVIENLSAQCFEVQTQRGGRLRSASAWGPDLLLFNQVIELLRDQRCRSRIKNQPNKQKKKTRKAEPARQKTEGRGDFINPETLMLEDEGDAGFDVHSPHGRHRRVDPSVNAVPCL